MLSPSADLAPSLMPLVRYRNVASAIGWLTRTFTVERRQAVTSSDGSIIYAQLSLGTARIMVEPAVADAETAGREQSLYVVIPDADAHYAKTCAEGADVDFPLHDFGQGGRGYSCRDLE